MDWRLVLGFLFSITLGGFTSAASPVSTDFDPVAVRSLIKKISEKASSEASIYDDLQVLLRVRFPERSLMTEEQITVRSEVVTSLTSLLQGRFEGRNGYIIEALAYWGDCCEEFQAKIGLALELALSHVPPGGSFERELHPFVRTFEHLNPILPDTLVFLSGFLLALEKHDNAQIVLLETVHHALEKLAGMNQVTAALEALDEDKDLEKMLARAEALKLFYKKHVEIAMRSARLRHETYEARADLLIAAFKDWLDLNKHPRKQVATFAQPPVEPPTEADLQARMVAELETVRGQSLEGANDIIAVLGSSDTLPEESLARLLCMAASAGNVSSDISQKILDLVVHATSAAGFDAAAFGRVRKTLEAILPETPIAFDSLRVLEALRKRSGVSEGLQGLILEIIRKGVSEHLNEKLKTSTGGDSADDGLFLSRCVDLLTEV